MIEKLEAEWRVVRDVMKWLDFPEDQYFLNGSAVLALHNIPRERPIGDIDIFLTTSLWFNFYNKMLEAGSITRLLGDYHKVGLWSLIVPNRSDQKRRCDPPILRGHFQFGDRLLPIDLFFSWRQRRKGNIDANQYMANAQEVCGLRCAPLQFIIDWKIESGRNKDLLDVVAIRQHFQTDVAGDD